MASMENISPSVVNVVVKELQKLLREPPEGIMLTVSDDDVTDIQAWISGPGGTPYEGGFFRMKVTIGSEFPAVPPNCLFLTQIYHPNISAKGEVCVSSLKSEWKSNQGIEDALLIVKGLLYQPNATSALNPDAARLLLTDEDAFVREAQFLTNVHASAVPAEVRRGLQERNQNSENIPGKNKIDPTGLFAAASKGKSDDAGGANGGEAEDVGGEGAKESSTREGPIDSKTSSSKTTAAKKRIADNKKLEKARLEKKRMLRRM